MNRILRSAGIEDGDLLIQSDVDEIPRAEVIQLFRWCEGVPPIVHLDTPAFVYSFGFQAQYSTWKATLHTYRLGHTGYSHGRQSDFRLMNAGWHCSFCFGTISQFQFKIGAYSHAERGSRHPRLASPDHIQEKICRGEDLYDMWPEAYTFGDLLQMLPGYLQIKSGVDLPRWAVENAHNWPWLLPMGHCLRTP